MRITRNTIIALTLIGTITVGLAIVAFARAGRTAGAPAMAISLSTDGHYAISSHRDGSIVLWNIKKRKKRIISTNGNIYSAYFVKRRNAFIWQDQSNVVHLDNLDNKSLMTFKMPPTYGEVMSTDLKNYYASDIGWAIYHRGSNGNVSRIKNGWGKAFYGFGKLLNLTLSNDGRYLLQSGAPYEFDSKISIHEEKGKNHYSEMVGVVLWDINTSRPIAKLSGNAVKTYATFSPEGKYIVSADEDSQAFVWQTNPTRRLYNLASVFAGKYIGKGKNLDGLYGEAFAKAAYDSTGLIPAPPDFEKDASLAIKFIDTNKRFLRFCTYQHYAILYKIGNPLPLKYLPLGRHPFPAVSDYSRNTAIDTAPAAGILVMGERNGNGIIVYHYNNKTETLKKVWVSD